ncbi:hypothetical protein L484_016145 [Morus notabilis]|uniref:Uncharacterized protein n=1 Tax=Morus notabilis TaxID=981085 RepID=W9QBK8_9ROSA|nr:hypothetical protein L484_016145 [Morus notabilis]
MSQNQSHTSLESICSTTASCHGCTGAVAHGLRLTGAACIGLSTVAPQTGVAGPIPTTATHMWALQPTVCEVSGPRSTGTSAIADEVAAMEVEKNMSSFLNPNVQLDHFNGTNFTTVFKIAYVLDPKLEPLSKPKEDDSKELKAARKKREDDEVMC